MTDEQKQAGIETVADATPVLVRQELDMQVATARAYPRSMPRFVDELRVMVTYDEGVAGEMFFTLKRRDDNNVAKNIVGPSIRFAEAVAMLWGNCRVGARIIEEGAQFIVAQGVFMDLERNVAHTSEVRRRIVGKTGRRYSADMIGVTANAACAIAKRNAALAGVPKPLWNAAWESARGRVVGDVVNLAKRRDDMLKFMRSMGVTDAAVFAALEVTDADGIGADELVTLKGMLNAMKEGEGTVRELFPEPGTTAAAETVDGAPLVGMDALRSKVMGKGVEGGNDGGQPDAGQADTELFGGGESGQPRATVQGDPQARSRSRK